MDWLQGFGAVLLRVFDTDLARELGAAVCTAAPSEHHRMAWGGRDLKILLPAALRDAFY